MGGTVTSLRKDLISFQTCLSINFLFTFVRTWRTEGKVEIRKRTFLILSQQKGQLRIIETLIRFLLPGDYMETFVVGSLAGDWKIFLPILYRNLSFFPHDRNWTLENLLVHFNTEEDTNAFDVTTSRLQNSIINYRESYRWRKWKRNEKEILEFSCAFILGTA